MQLAGVRIGADDAAGAIAAYATLLAVPGTSSAGRRDALRLGTWHRRRRPRPPRSARRPLPLCRRRAAAPRCAWHRPRGRIATCRPTTHRPRSPSTTSSCTTTAPERAIALWRDRMGLRLALDREFPARHLRLLFFRSGGITLEYASPLPAPDEAAGDDRLHGVSYRVTDLAARRERLLAAGVDVSPLRRGMRRGHDGGDRAVRDRRRAHPAAPGRRLSNRLLQAVSTSVDGEAAVLDRRAPDPGQVR